MTQYQQQVKEFMTLVGQDCPAKPVIPDDQTAILRSRLTVEETLEFVYANGITMSLLIDGITIHITDLSDLIFEKTHEANIVEIADAVADMGYINNGSALACGIDMEEIEQAVHENNMTKITTGYKDDNGKFRKGPDYKPVDLSPIIEKQINNEE